MSKPTITENRNARWMYIEQADGTISHICDLQQRKMYALDIHDDAVGLFNHIVASDDLNKTYYDMLKAPAKKVLQLWHCTNKTWQHWEDIWAYDYRSAVDYFIETNRYDRAKDDITVVERHPENLKTVVGGGW